MDLLLSDYTDTDNVGLVITVLVLLAFAMFVRLRQ
jgi:hypothetical protein